MENLNDTLNACVPSFARDLRVLLVDRDTSSLLMVASMLEQYTFKGKFVACPFSVTTTEMASTALAMIQDEKDRSFNLVIADPHMKDMDILQFMDMVLKKDIPIILMTSTPSVGVNKKWLAKGVSFCYEKPISQGDLRYVWQYFYRQRSNPVLRLSCSIQGSNSRAEEEMSFGNKPQGIEFREPSFSPNAAPRNNLPAITTDRNWTYQLGDMVLFGASDPQVITAEPKEKRKLFELEVREHDFDSLKKNKQFEAEAYHGIRHQQMINYHFDPNIYSINGEVKSFVQGEGLMRRGPIDDLESLNKGRQFKMNLEQIHSMPEISYHEDEEDELKDQGDNSSKKRKRAIWTRELHLKFTAALSRLGDKKATPKTILRLMKVPEVNQRQVASHLQKYRAQVKQICEASTATLQSACESIIGVGEMSAEKNNSLAKGQSQRGLEVGTAQTLALQQQFGNNFRFLEATVSYNERLKFATYYANATIENPRLFPIQWQNDMRGKNLAIADKRLRNLPVENKELQTIEASAPPASAKNQEMVWFADDVLKDLEDDADKIENLGGQLDSGDVDRFFEWLEKDAS